MGLSHRLFGKLWRAPESERHANPPEGGLLRPLLRLGEILAASSVPDVADLPMELWPGYRDLSASGDDCDPRRQQRREHWDVRDASRKRC
jgi:hypothetical protein